MIDSEKVKSESNKRLSSLGITTNDGLPVLEGLSELSPKSSKDVASRAMIITQLIGIAFDAPAKKLHSNLKKYGLLDDLSQGESVILSANKPSPQNKIDLEWQAECMQSFAWCFNLADINLLSHCDDELYSKFPSPHVDPGTFIKSVNLRPFNDIYQQADVYYRLHWAAKQAKYENTAFPVSESIIRERRRALDWVIGVEDNWDEVPSDT